MRESKRSDSVRSSQDSSSSSYHPYRNDGEGNHADKENHSNRSRSTSRGEKHSHDSRSRDDNRYGRKRESRDRSYSSSRSDRERPSRDRYRGDYERGYDRRNSSDRYDRREDRYRDRSYSSRDNYWNRETRDSPSHKSASYRERERFSTKGAGTSSDNTNLSAPISNTDPEILPEAEHTSLVVIPTHLRTQQQERDQQESQTRNSISASKTVASIESDNNVPSDSLRSSLPKIQQLQSKSSNLVQQRAHTESAVQLSQPVQPIKQAMQSKQITPIQEQHSEAKSAQIVKSVQQEKAAKVQHGATNQHTSSILGTSVKPAQEIATIRPASVESIPKTKLASQDVPSRASQPTLNTKANHMLKQSEKRATIQCSILMNSKKYFTFEECRGSCWIRETKQKADDCDDSRSHNVNYVLKTIEANFSSACKTLALDHRIKASTKLSSRIVLGNFMTNDTTLSNKFFGNSQAESVLGKIAPRFIPVVNSGYIEPLDGLMRENTYGLLGNNAQYKEKDIFMIEITKDNAKWAARCRLVVGDRDSHLELIELEPHKKDTLYLVHIWRAQNEGQTAYSSRVSLLLPKIIMKRPNDISLILFIKSIRFNDGRLVAPSSSFVLSNKYIRETVRSYKSPGLKCTIVKAVQQQGDILQLDDAKHKVWFSSPQLSHLCESGAKIDSNEVRTCLLSFVRRVLDIQRVLL